MLAGMGFEIASPRAIVLLPRRQHHYRIPGALCSPGPASQERAGVAAMARAPLRQLGLSAAPKPRGSAADGIDDSAYQPGTTAPLVA